jgi:hypothetical protein
VSSPRGDAPTLGVVVTGGIGVLVVLAFVGAIVFGRSAAVGPGDRVAVVSSDKAPAGFTVLAGRCQDERVTSVEIHAPGGPPLWRLESAKGVIDRSFRVGGDAPFGAAIAVPLQPLPPGPLEAVITVDGKPDAETFDPAHLETAKAPEAPCGDLDLGLVPFLFVVGALGVVVTYVLLVRRYVRP